MGTLRESRIGLSLPRPALALASCCTATLPRHLCSRIFLHSSSMVVFKEVPCSELNVVIPFEPAEEWSRRSETKRRVILWLAGKLRPTREITDAERRSALLASVMLGRHGKLRWLRPYHTDDDSSGDEANTNARTHASKQPRQQTGRER